MRLIFALSLFILFISCKPKMHVFIVNENESTIIKDLDTYFELFNLSNKLACEESQLIISNYPTGLSNSENIFLISECPDVTSCPKYYIMPICDQDLNSKSIASINLQDSQKVQYEIMKDFVLNPRKISNYPNHPSKAVFTISLEDKTSIKKTIQYISKLSMMHNQILFEIGNEIPLILLLKRNGEQHFNNLPIDFMN